MEDIGTLWERMEQLKEDRGWKDADAHGRVAIYKEVMIEVEKAGWKIWDYEGMLNSVVLSFWR